MNNQLRKPSSFGAKLNTYEQPRRQADYLAWANAGQREDWRSCGLVLWKDDARQIIRLSDQDALDVLADMRSNSTRPNTPNKWRVTPVCRCRQRMNWSHKQAFASFLFSPTA